MEHISVANLIVLHTFPRLHEWSSHSAVSYDRDHTRNVCQSEPRFRDEMVLSDQHTETRSQNWRDLKSTDLFVGPLTYYIERYSSSLLVQTPPPTVRTSED